MTGGLSLLVFMLFELLTIARGVNNAHDDHSFNIKKSFEQEEIRFLMNKQFYRDGEGELNVIVQVHDKNDHSALKESVILKERKQCAFVRVVGDEFNFISDSELVENTMDDLFDNLKRNKDSDQPPTLVIVDHFNGMLFHRSKFVNNLESFRPVFYFNNHYEVMSKELIDFLIEAGFNLFWHFPLQESSVHKDQAALIVEGIPIRLIAIPLERHHLIQSVLSYRGVYSYKMGNYYVSQYDMKVSVLETENDLKFFFPDNNMDEIESKADGSIGERTLTYTLSQNEDLPPMMCPECSSSVTKESSGNIKSNVFINITINLESIYLDVSNSGLDHTTFHFKNPHITANMLGPTMLRNFATLFFPSSLSKVGERVYMDFYCRQIEQSDEEGFSLQLYSKCSVYISHLLREEVALLQHLSKSSLVSDTATTIENRAHFFDSWRGPPELDGRPGVSIHVNDSDLCTEPVFCKLGNNVQNQIYKWQNPPVVHEKETERMCANSKFVVYLSTLKWASIGSWIHQTTMLLHYAMCHDRILLMPTKGILQRVHDYMQSMGPNFDNYTPHLRWFHDKCNNDESVFDCYFKRMSSCAINETEYFSTLFIYNGQEPFLETALFSNAKYVSISFIPFIGSCSIGSKSWGGSFSFFGDMDIGMGAYAERTKVHEWGAVHSLLEGKSTRGDQYGAFAGGDTSPFKAQLMRYIMRPQRWFSDALAVAIQNRLSNGGIMPRPFANLHIRYGEKVLEMKLVPLRRYMKVLRRKAPHIKNVFVTTETEAVFHNLTRDYPDYNFYFTRFERNTHLHTSLKEGHVIDYQMDFFMSMSNLFVSIEADFFVGTIASGWCQMINQLQRTRGDGGTHYNAVDSV